MLQRTGMMIWKEFIQIFRDPRMLTVVVLIPVVMLLLYGFAINFDVKHVRMAVCDFDNSMQSRDLVGAFSRSGYFDIVANVRDTQLLNGLLDEGKAKIILFIPPSYHKELARREKARVQLLLDGSDSTSASTALGYVNVILQQQSTKMALAVLPASVGRSLPIEHRVRYWYNPGLVSTNFIIPGLIAVILMALSALLTSVTVVRERERGTLELLIVSPVQPLEIMLGKLIPYIIIAYGDVLLVLLASRFIFQVPLRGSLLLVLLLSGIFLTAALGIGLFISTVAPTQQVAMLVAILATQLPAVLLSGFIFPISSMPRVIQWMSNIIPATHFIHILRAIFLKGVGLSLLWRPALYLLCIGVAMLTISAARFRKKL